MNATTLTAAFALVLAIPAPGVPAQQTAGVAPVEQTANLLLVDRLSADSAKAMIVRRLGSGDVILVTRSTTPQELALAASVLLGSRARVQPTGNQEMRAVISAATTRAGSWHADETRMARARADLDRLYRAPVTSIPGLQQRGRSLRIVL